jgi:hypothetical protein
MRNVTDKADNVETLQIDARDARAVGLANPTS